VYLYVEVTVPLLESERSCIYMLGYRFCLFLWFCRISELFRHCSISFCFSCYYGMPCFKRLLSFHKRISSQ